MTTCDPRPTLGSSFDPRRNSFGFLRIVLALLVFFQHGLIAGGFAPAPGAHSHTDLAAIAVDCFFAISGFLITRSRLRIRSSWRFLWHRFLRILPAFWACLVFTALVIAPLGWLYTRGTLHGYFTADVHGPFSYLRANCLLLMHFYDIAGTPDNVPITALPNGPVAWDGSLWSLFWEALCYLGVAVLGATGLLRRRPWVLWALAGSLWLLWVVRWLDPAVLPTALNNEFVAAAVRLGSLFLAGAALCVYADRIPDRAWLGPLAAALAIGALALPDGHAAASLPMAYACVWAALRAPLVPLPGGRTLAPHRVGVTTDLSYGVYIYSAPVQQLLAVYGLYRLGVAAWVLISLAGTLLVALASWRFVEAPALRHKNDVLAGPVAVLAAVRRGRPLPLSGRRTARDTTAVIPVQRDPTRRDPAGGDTAQSGATASDAVRADGQSAALRRDRDAGGGGIVGEQQQGEQNPQEKADPVGGHHG
ncbi:acyltransferase family protein [Candidatus Frankia nodulisporulans]|uniref:acyltransferase family protein n=1 Tax=Candidatus Frankia nodulisporulans TaxID=2060052 RepID=UPI0013D6C6FF|nr:acyltransferase [Candidatus Frankia nodulisporulans]